MASVMQQVFVAVTIFIIPSNQYFSYSDCDAKCITRNSPCMLVKLDSGRFSSFCTPLALCELHTSEYAPCIKESSPTSGGLRLWPEYRNRTLPPKPTVKPCPPIPQTPNCNFWKYLSAIQGLVSLSTLSGIVMLKLLKFRARLSYEPVDTSIVDDPTMPYRTTVQSIDEASGSGIERQQSPPSE